MSVQPTLTRNWTGSITLRFPYDADLVESLKAEIPGHARKYDPIGKSWTVTASYAHDIEVEERARPGAPSDHAPHAGDPYVVLHLLPSAPPELVTAAHRCLAKLNHPDRGGSTATMQAINAAVDAIREVS